MPPKGRACYGKSAGPTQRKGRKSTELIANPMTREEVEVSQISPGQCIPIKVVFACQLTLLKDELGPSPPTRAPKPIKRILRPRIARYSGASKKCPLSKNLREGILEALRSDKYPTSEGEHKRGTSVTTLDYTSEDDLNLVMPETNPRLVGNSDGKAAGRGTSGEQRPREQYTVNNAAQNHACTIRPNFTSRMHLTIVFAVAATSITHVATMSVPRPWIHEDAQSYILERKSSDAHPSSIAAVANDLKLTTGDAKKTIHLIRDTKIFEIPEDKWQQPPLLEGKGKGLQGHDEYLPPGPAPHTQEEIDAAAHYMSPDGAIDLDSNHADAKTEWQLFYRSADSAEGADGKRHRLHSHENYLEELGRNCRLHSHDEYLKDSKLDAAKSTKYTPGGTKEGTGEKVQRRCVWSKNCKEICAQGGVGGLIGCTWNCGGDANMPTCPE
ncbi:uncharacterized protein CC84DRAFT_1203465 [Paraphaeosphaeria sporulosa]|uniref:Uncharacterized protein n=1 Tax=Paraphaeosphaeria sporulosa TaxID=1460663 RepID=A0A177CKW5_9PLEO|nr:uncharacterized protein CC84DRAFT_1203465 [Paraphaeosphaeria sporulosa]OAG07946.1 hypothetical protein CC84DRAFT_1203465 [Paraphaeosphaeria sporulosa]